MPRARLLCLATIGGLVVACSSGGQTTTTVPAGGGSVTRGGGDGWCSMRSSRRCRDCGRQHHRRNKWCGWRWPREPRLQEAADLLDEGAESVAVNYWTGFTAIGGRCRRSRSPPSSRPTVGDHTFAVVSLGGTDDLRLVLRSEPEWKVDVVASFGSTLVARLADAVEVVAANSGDGADRLREVLGRSEGQRRHRIGRLRSRTKLLARLWPISPSRCRTCRRERTAASRARPASWPRLSQTGLAFAKSPFDIQRYEEVGEIAAELASHGEADALQSRRDLPQ